MINKQTGQLSLNSKQKIEPNMTLKQFNDLNLVDDKTEESNKNICIHLKNENIENDFFNISFHFNNQNLTHLTFVFQNTPYQDNLGWDSWSKEQEDNNLIRFNNWIENTFDNQTSFSWGTINALYDSKTGMSLIEIKYK